LNRNPAAYWTLTFEAQPQCISKSNLLLAAGTVNSFTDLLVIFLPMSIVFKLKLPQQQRIGIALLFGVGILITLVGIARTIYLYRLSASFDVTWDVFPFYIASVIEFILAL
jgi:hypothetical protein